MNAKEAIGLLIGRHRALVARNGGTAYNRETEEALNALLRMYREAGRIYRENAAWRRCAGVFPRWARGMAPDYWPLLQRAADAGLDAAGAAWHMLKAEDTLTAKAAHSFEILRLTRELDPLIRAGGGAAAREWAALMEAEEEFNRTARILMETDDGLTRRDGRPLDLRSEVRKLICNCTELWMRDYQTEYPSVIESLTWGALYPRRM